MSEWLELLFELILLAAMVALVHLNADMRFIIEASILYLAMVIRHQGSR